MAKAMPGRWLTVRAASGRAAKLGLRMRERFGMQQLAQTPLGGRVICEERDLLYEEAPAAYKNIEAVIQDLVDAGLVSVIATLPATPHLQDAQAPTLSASSHAMEGTAIHGVNVCQRAATPWFHIPASKLLSVNAKQLEQPVFQAGPNRCESDHGCQFVRVAQLVQSAGVRRRRSQVRFLSWTPFSALVPQQQQGGFRKPVFVGASPTRGSISNGGHDVTAASRPVKAFVSVRM